MEKLHSKRLISSLIGAVITVLVSFLIDKFSNIGIVPEGGRYWTNKLILGVAMFCVFYFINGFRKNRKDFSEN